MLNLEFIRRHPDLVKEGVARKRDAAPIDEILGLDEERRRLLAESEQLKARRNEASKEIGRLMKQDPARAEQLRAEMRATGDRIRELDAAVAQIEPRLHDLLMRVPNLPEPSVPVGKDESENVVRRHWGEPRRFEFTPQPHWEIAERLGIVDFERGSRLSGSRFYVLRGLGARLERTLIGWMLDLHTREHGYLEIWPPYLVKPEAMLGTGQLPKFGEDMYHVEPDDLYLIPTAEVPLTNLHAGEILEPGTLPIRYVGFTPCFRREAGAAGRDTRGLVRVHQFDKVELVKLVEPATSYDELDKLIANAEEVLRRLELPYRVTQMCTGDLGFAAAMKYDLEVWMPGQDRYVEISSCSNFEDFQARRAGIRYRPATGARAELVHTLNGSALAIGRTFAALLETYQQADGTVVVPEALRGLFGVDLIA